MIETPPDERPLVHRAGEAFAAFQAGDRAAFDELVRLLTPLLWHTVRSQGVDAVSAEDVVQTIWMRLLHSSSSIRDPQTVLKWLLTAVRREAWRIAKRTRDELARTAALFGADGHEVPGIPVRPEQATDEVVLREERRRRLWEHVRGLPERCRQLLRVVAFADRPDYAQIADALGMPVGSIGPTRGRCLAKLRQELAADPQWEGKQS